MIKKSKACVVFDNKDTLFDTASKNFNKNKYLKLNCSASFKISL